jgi:polar amino acid transport system permease protein
MDFQYLISVGVPMVSKGLIYTLGLAVVTVIFSIPLGLCFTLLRISKIKIFRFLTGFYVWIMRGTPLMLQLFFVMYGLPFVPWIGEYMIFDRFMGACITFVLNYAAYFCEIFRGGILSIDKGQYEASQVLGLNKRQTNIHIVLPQMFRVSLPAMGNELINLIKDTALITAIGITEILRYASNATSRDSRPEAFIPAAIIYLSINFVLTRILTHLEKKTAID